MFKAWKVALDDGIPPILRRDISILNSIDELLSHNLFNNIGSASKSNIANIHRYTANGDYLNVPIRGLVTENPLHLPNVQLNEFEFQSYLSIKEGLEKLRLTNRLETGFVNRGRTFSQEHYNILFGTNSPQAIPLKGFQSATKDIEVAKTLCCYSKF